VFLLSSPQHPSVSYIIFIAHSFHYATRTTATAESIPNNQPARVFTPVDLVPVDDGEELAVPVEDPEVVVLTSDNVCNGGTIVELPADGVTCAEFDVVVIAVVEVTETDVCIAVAEAVPVLELDETNFPPVIMNGCEYWKMLLFESKDIIRP
jgi:hypothetical protein